jgi:hypothetical protein
VNGVHSSGVIGVVAVERSATSGKCLLLCAWAFICIQILSAKLAPRGVFSHSVAQTYHGKLACRTVLSMGPIPKIPDLWINISLHGDGWHMLLTTQQIIFQLQEINTGILPHGKTCSAKGSLTGISNYGAVYTIRTYISVTLRAPESTLVRHERRV